MHCSICTVSKGQHICDLIKQNESEVCKIHFPDCLYVHHLQSYLLQQTPLMLVNWFQRYEQLSVTKTIGNK